VYRDDLGQEDYYSYTKKTTEEAQELAVRLGVLCRVYEQADRVLTQDPVNVHVVKDDNLPPAWSDGKDVFINSSQIDSFDLDELIQINGLNYHELAHHLYTPRRGTELVKWVLEQDQQSSADGFLQSFNILEDQRIETLLTARYPSIVPYLTKTVVRWLSDSPETMAANYLVIRGRRYLPVELRVQFRDLFARQELIPAIIDIVDQYRTLAFPKDYAKAKELIQRFKLEVIDKIGTPNLPKSKPGECTGRSPVALGRPEAGKAQFKDSERAKGLGQAEPTFVPKPEESEQDTDKGKRDDDDTDINNPPPSGVGMSNPTSSDAPYQPKTAAEAIKLRDVHQQPPSSTAGSGHVESVGGIPDNVAELLSKIETDIASRKDVQQDVKTKQRVIVGGDGKHEDSIKLGKFSSVPVPASILLSARRFGRELERLRQDCEPTWQREMPAGRLNVQRVIRGCEIDEAFDRWEEGSDGTDIEAVLLIDRSGSMSYDHNDMRASEAAWVIKRSLEQIDCPVTIYAFDDKTELVSSKNTKTSKTTFQFIFGNGGTNPKNSLIATERLLNSSRRKSKVMFIVTDGEFSNNTDTIIERMNANGILTVLVMISSPAQLAYIDENRSESAKEAMKHKCSIFGTVTNAADLIPFAKQVVTSMIKNKMHS